MRVEHGVLNARRSGCSGRLWAVTAVLLLGACEHLHRESESSLSRAVLLETGAELPVVMSLLGTRARRTVSGADSIRVAIHFDPEMIDVADVASYTLWGRSSESSEWKRIKEISAADLPSEMSFKEGTVGLRASARYRDGREVFLPRPSDEPVVWLVVDRSAPSLMWLKPAANAPVKAGPVELLWTMNEVETGAEPCIVEWSADGGQTWKLIAKVAPRSGHQSHLWSVPSDLDGSCQIRVTAHDLAGHANSSVLPIDVVSVTPGATVARGSSSAGAFSGSAPVPGVATKAAGRAPSAGPAVGDDSPRSPGGQTVLGKIPSSEIPLQLEPMATGIVGGGKNLEVRWRSLGIPAEQEVKAEWSRDGGKTWQLAGASPISAGVTSWEIPCVDVSDCLLRLRTTSADGRESVSVASRTFGIDCTPPTVAFVSVPEVVGRLARFDLRWDDGAGSGLDEVNVFMRSPPGTVWRPVPASIVRLELNARSPGHATLALDLQSVAEGPCEICLEGIDRVGNRTEMPQADTAPMASFSLDKTPPHLVVTPYPLPWSEGMLADIQIDADWRDVALPVVLFGRGSRRFSRSTGQGQWQELARWTRLPPNTRQFSWTVPTGFSELSVKVEVQDRAGNKSSQVVNARRVEPAIYLEGLTGGMVLEGGTTRRLQWKLHSAAVGRGGELRVQVEYQRAAGGAWEPICRDLTVLEQCVWEVPQGDGSDGHRIRLCLERGGQLVSEYRSEPFEITSGRPAFQEPLIPQDSMNYFEIARSFAKQYHEARRALAGQTVTPEAQDRIDELVQHAKESFRKALELAESNYHAAYAYAQFLNRLPERDDQEVERLLRQVIQFKPTHYWAYNDLGALYIREQKYERAEIALREAAKLEPSADVQYNLGLALFHQRKVVEARAQFRAALESPRQGRVHHGVLHYYLIRTFLQEGELNQAQVLYQKHASGIPADLREQLRRVFET